MQSRTRRSAAQRPQGLSVLGLGVLALCSAGFVACKKKPPVLPTLPESSAEIVEVAPSAEPSPGPVKARCHELGQGGPFVIGEVAPSRSPSEDDDGAGPDEDDEVPAPFSVELGPARPDAAGFVVGALRSTRGQAHALVALVNAEAKAGKLLDLGAVHGDPDPPLVAVRGADLVVVASDTDAGGGMLRIGLVQDARGAAPIHWGQEITGVRRDSTFALETAGERALVVYASENSGKIRVYGALFDPNQPKNKLTPEPLSAAGADVDSPRLALRKGGFWLAVARSLDAPKPKAKTPMPEAGAEEIGDDSLLDLGTRRIEISKLDAQGKSASTPLVVTNPGQRPMNFDLASAPDGGAYLAFRDDDSTPGADGGALELIHVKADGTFEKLPLDGASNGAGVPSLLVDASQPQKVWLSAVSESGATLFGQISANTKLLPDPAVRGADLIAARDGHLLSLRAKSTAAELSALECAAE